jgi:hypothetical protein
MDGELLSGFFMRRRWYVEALQRQEHVEVGADADEERGADRRIEVFVAGE